MSKLRKISTVITNVLGTLIGQTPLALEKPFLTAFEKYGILITKQEATLASVNTGISKDSHIREILRLPTVIHRYEKEKKRKPDLIKDVKAIFDLYTPLQIEALSNPDFIRPLPGVIQTLTTLKDMGIKIGTTTGFTTVMMQTILAHSEEKIGSYLDVVIACDHPSITRGRPYPDGVWSNMIALGCNHVNACIKVDDTKVGIEEGSNAGVNTLGVVRYGNFTGTYTDDIDALERDNNKEAQRILRMAWLDMEEANPTYLCQSLEGIIPLINLHNTSIDKNNKVRHL